MASYKELKAQLKKLSEEAETARLAELQAVIEHVRAKVAEYGLTVEDIFGRQRASRRATKTPVPPKYRDPKTGATWSGRGRAPDWIKGRKRDRFLIES
ncbi:H-NS family nucleoid-associated regulatory protein [Paraburkholderia sp. SIMBA_030]|uniref:H-NS histone family protein n=1 Tax=Paraburkholderia sp. SIMBA_030 TaxID=3085773 RepID=UPI00397892F7